MRLIDADKLSEHKFTLESAKGGDYMRGWNHAIDAIVDNEPTVERPQGEWIEKVERRGCFAGDKTVYSYTCPFCGVKEFKKYPFCHCGADMRIKDELGGRE